MDGVIEKKYRVYVSWMVAAETVVEAKDEQEAIELAHGIDLDTFDKQEYIPHSFEADLALPDGWSSFQPSGGD